MQNVVWDIETNGLLDDLTKVHCLVVKDLDTGQVLSCTDNSPDYPSIEEGLQVLSQAKRLYGHNLIGFDIPALQKVYPEWSFQGKVFDTLVMVQLRYAHIKESDYERAAQRKLPSNLIGSQGIEAWGYRLGIHKGEYTKWCEQQGIEDAWSEWRPEMQDYCEQDVEVNESLVRKLRKAKGISQESLDADLELSWYLAQQERNGWPIQEENLRDLIVTLTDRKRGLEEVLIDRFGSWFVSNGEVTPKRTMRRKSGTPGVWEHVTKGAPYTKIKLIEFNPNSRHHISDRLIKVYGWEPIEFTPSGQPKVDESTLKGLSIPITDELNEYLMVAKRLGQVSEGTQAWTKHLNDDGYQGGRLTGMRHIHHSIRNVTVTHRHRHSHPNLGQVPASYSPYGKECRAVFTVPEGWVLVGADADGLELRCLAHYMGRYDGGKYAKAILEGRKEDGTDIHSMNAKALGLSRDDAKTWIYAWLYGAGDAKLGSISHPTTSEQEQRKIGARQKTDFLQKVPALKHLQDAIKAAVKRGYVLLPDKRRAYIRHEHAALNTLLQGAGSIIVKHWIVNINRALCERFGTPPGGGWQHEWAAVGWIHDEVQIAVREEYAEVVKEILVSTIQPVAKKFGWRLPLAAGADIGRTWRETH